MLKKRERKSKNYQGSNVHQDKKVAKVMNKFRIYVGALAAITILFVAHLVFTLYIQPRRASGTPIFGNRLEYVEEIPDRVVTTTEEFGLSQARVEDLTVTITGKIVYFDVRVEERTDVVVARTTAEEIADFFLDEAGDSADGYNLQLVVATGDINELKASNRQEMDVHIKEHILELLEKITNYAETYPTEENINRIYNNVNVWSWDSEEVTQFKERADALEPMTKEDEEKLAEANHGVLPSLDVSELRLIPQSNIAEFPSWGTLNSGTGEIHWH